MTCQHHVVASPSEGLIFPAVAIRMLLGSGRIEIRSMGPLAIDYNQTAKVYGDEVVGEVIVPSGDFALDALTAFLQGHQGDPTI